MRDESIWRLKSGQLEFLGPDNSPFKERVERVNEGKATEFDLLVLSSLPVFDEETVMEDSILIIERRSKP